MFPSFSLLSSVSRHPIETDFSVPDCRIRCHGRPDFGDNYFCSRRWHGPFGALLSRPALRYQVSTTGVILTAQALFYVIVTPFVAPLVVQQFGPQNAVVAIVCLWPIVMLLFPVNIWLASPNSPLMFVGVAMLVMVKALASIAWP